MSEPGSESGKSKPLHKSPQSITSDELKRSGEEAARLLDSPIYNLAHRSVIQNLQDEWMQTEPKELQRREQLYNMVRSLSQVSNELAGMVAEAKALDESELANERKLQLAYDENAGFR